MYNIKMIKDIKEIENGEVANVDVYNWGGVYRPKTRAILCFVKDRGFAVKMICEEKDPLVTIMAPEGYVSIDSCMEFFANFYPNEQDTPYINFEANAIGAMCCEFGTKGGLRPKLSDNGIELPQITPIKKENEWGFVLFIPLSLIQSVYNKSDFKSGDIIKGNFYKCGEKTKSPHYASYTTIESEIPSFHKPEFFAQMIIAE